MPFAATSYGLGLTRLDLRSFTLGTLASLPALLGYVAVGALGNAGLSLGSRDAGLLRMTLLALGAVGTMLFVIRLRRLIQKTLARTAVVETF